MSVRKTAGRTKKASQKQIEANRGNAAKSTGPKTAKGKAKSSRNAEKHGLTASRLVLADEDAQAFSQLQVSLTLELAPATELEQMLVNRIAAQHWRLNRIPALEAQTFARLRRGPVGEDLGLGGAWHRDGGPSGGSLSRLVRYESLLERSLARLLGELRKLQAARRQREREAAQAADRQVQARWNESPALERAYRRDPFVAAAAAQRGWPGIDGSDGIEAIPAAALLRNEAISTGRTAHDLTPAQLTPDIPSPTGEGNSRHGR